MAERSAADIWAEILRTAALIEGYGPLLERVEDKILQNRLGGDVAADLLKVVSDAQILVGLIKELEHSGSPLD